MEVARQKWQTQMTETARKHQDGTGTVQVHYVQIIYVQKGSHILRYHLILSCKMATQEFL